MDKHSDDLKKYLVNVTLKDMEKFFHGIEPSLMYSVSREEYLNQHPEEKSLDFPFTSAEYIINHKIPYGSVGCAGRTKLFSKFARDNGLTDFFIVTTVMENKIGKEGYGQIPGHQMVAIKLSDGLHLIDVATGIGKTIDDIKINYKPVVNSKISYDGDDYIITKLLTPEEFDTIDTYEKIKAVYFDCSAVKKILMQQATGKIKNENVLNQITNDIQND